MRVQIIKHIDFEGPGYIYDYMIQKGYAVDIKLMSHDLVLPEVKDFDFLILMGGPMGAYDQAIYPWLHTEKKFIASAIETGKKVLGVCLGCQLLADVLGAKVYPGPYREFGWYPVTLTNDGENSKFTKNFPKTFYPLHWHGDTFDLPKGAKLLASSEAYPNQLIAYESNVLGIQFHLEFRAEDIIDVAELGKLKSISGPWAQEAKDVYTKRENFNAAHRLLEILLDSVCSA